MEAGSPSPPVPLIYRVMKKADDGLLAELVLPFLRQLGVASAENPKLGSVMALLKDRANSLRHLAESAHMFYAFEEPSAASVAGALTEKTRPALKMLQAKLAESPWDRKSLGAVVSAVVKASGLKMPELAMPARLLVTGRTQTPSLDAVLELLGREIVLARLARHLG